MFAADRFRGFLASVRGGGEHGGYVRGGPFSRISGECSRRRGARRMYMGRCGTLSGVSRKESVRRSWRTTPDTSIRLGIRQRGHQAATIVHHGETISPIGPLSFPNVGLQSNHDICKRNVKKKILFRIPPMKARELFRKLPSTALPPVIAAPA